MDSQTRRKIFVQGIVQGVGFRPFVYRLAVGNHLKGFVSNSSRGVEIEVEGETAALDHFIDRLKSDLPPLAKITRLDFFDVPIENSDEFVIRSSRIDSDKTALISPDMSICDDCLRELFDEQDRRFRYPFINCTNCGPRYTIIKDIPYDRPKTTMKSFSMCLDCQREYDDPMNRRFHAQPNACPVCGPRVWLTDAGGQQIDCDNPITEAARVLKQGKIVAVKGLGGFHLACDAFNEQAVRRLRKRKNREEKPLAVMVPNTETIHQFSIFSEQEKDLLLFQKRPIVLLKKKPESSLAGSVSPRNGFVGVMLPYTPLHYLLLQHDFEALVMTSGNISEEPIAIANEEALKRLNEIADFYLFHDRDIHLRSDDSVTRIVAGLPRPIRRSRGYVPVPVFLRNPVSSVLAVGGELKNTICLTKDDRAFLSQHIGDLENLETLNFFEECVVHLKRILQINPVAIAHDLHPDYLSTQWAQKQKNISLIAVQHHHAHIASCLADNGLDEKVIGLSLDGTGYGDDGHIWGGEVLLADCTAYTRAAHFDYRPMPGGAAAIKEPWRMAVAYLYSAYRNYESDCKKETFLRWIEDLPLLAQIGNERIVGILQMIDNNINTPFTSSLGRLFDGVSALTGLRNRVAYEGQAAIELEMAMDDCPDDGVAIYPFEIIEADGKFIIFPDSVICSIMNDVLTGISPAKISCRFHRSLVHLFVDVCQKVRQQTGLETVALSGGCFLNRYLLENLMLWLKQTGFKVYTHSQVPTNDGGIALGQAVIAAARLKQSKTVSLKGDMSQ